MNAWFVELGLLEFSHLIAAAAATLIYASMCLLIFRKELVKRRSSEVLSAIAGGDTLIWRVAYASQTGTAEEIARLTADTFHLAGVRAQLCELSKLDAGALADSQRILFIVSTYGEGDPPDNGAVFAERLLGQPLRLDHLHYAILILGDRSYSHFGGFGRELDGWLSSQGAHPLFPRIDVDRCDPTAITAWHQQLSHLAGTDDAPDWQGPAFSAWRLVERKHLNAGSQGNEIFHLELEPVDAALPYWQSGDLAQIQVPTDAHPREYSIASIPRDGRVHLLVRLHRHGDGSFGAASGWLTQSLDIGGSVALRLRRHERFRLGDNAARPLILIANGSGIAGLRGHLKSRAASGQGGCWLLFGERNAACDYHYRQELEAWRESGLLDKLDVVFSRDQTQRRYVQDRLLESADEIRQWVDRGAAIYVCGSLQGMAAGVDAAFDEIVGKSANEELSLAGRYRRDVY